MNNRKSLAYTLLSGIGEIAAVLTLLTGIACLVMVAQWMMK